MPRDDQLRAMLRDLGRSLAHAISASEDIHEAVRRFHREGFTLQLRLDCRHEVDDREAGIQLSSGQAGVGGTPREPISERSPEFRLDGEDVEFLRSLGIDPTRPAPRR